MPVLRLRLDVAVVAFAWVALQLLDVVPLPYYLREIGVENLVLNATLRRYLHLGAALYLIFRLWPVSRTAPIIGIVFALVAVICAVYSIASYGAHAAGTWSQLDSFVAGLGVLILWEAIRRVLGLPVALVVAAFLSLAAAHFYQLDGIGGVSKLLLTLWFTTEGVFGYAMGLSDFSGFLFILLGAALQQASVGKGLNRTVYGLLAAICGPQSGKIFLRAFHNRFLVWTMIGVFFLLTYIGSFGSGPWMTTWLWKPAAYSQVLAFLIIFFAASLPFMRMARFSGEPENVLTTFIECLWLTTAALTVAFVAIGRSFPAVTTIVWVFLFAIPAFGAWAWRERRQIEAPSAGPTPFRVRASAIGTRAAAAVSGTGSSVLLLSLAFLLASLLLAANYGLTELLWGGLSRESLSPLMVIAGAPVIFGIFRFGLNQWQSTTKSLTIHLLLWLIPVHVVFFAAFDLRKTGGSAAFYGVCAALLCLVVQRVTESYLRGSASKPTLWRKLGSDAVYIVARCVTVAAMIAVTAGAVGIVLWSGINLRN